MAGTRGTLRCQHHPSAKSSIWKSAFFTSCPTQERCRTAATLKGMTSSTVGHNRTFATMKNSRTEFEAAAGRLISAIQKEWHSEAGERSRPRARQSCIRPTNCCRPARPGRSRPSLAQAPYPHTWATNGSRSIHALCPILRHLKPPVEHQAAVGQEPSFKFNRNE